MFVFSLHTFAQGKMKVLSFELNESDMTASRQGTSRQDVNGKNAALIRIEKPTSDNDYSFDCGSTGQVGDTEFKGGEIWVYVPRGSMKITISHPKYGVLREYEYPVGIKSGKTYIMRLDPGVGKYVNINSNPSGASLFIDGDSIGITPVYQRYLPFGIHNIKCVKEKFLYERQDTIKDDENQDINLEMEDMSKYYVNVTLNVNDNAEIYYQGKKRGVGQWTNEFYQGTYTIETRKENCYDKPQTLNVTPGMNPVVTLDTPEPHKGYLKVTTTPPNAYMTINGVSGKVGDQHPLLVGKHEVTLTRRGYHDELFTVDIKKDELFEKEVKLKPILYLKKNQVYLGAGYTYNDLMGVSAYAGFTLFNIDVQASYTIGLSSTDNLIWYKNDEFSGKVNYKQNVFSVKLGYQIQATPRLGFTPQVGYSMLQLKGSAVEGTANTGDGAKCDALSLGARIEIAPAQHIGIFINPEYIFGFKKDGVYEYITDKLGMTAGGFYASAGLFVKF